MRRGVRIVAFGIAVILVLVILRMSPYTTERYELFTGERAKKRCRKFAARSLWNTYKWEFRLDPKITGKKTWQCPDNFQDTGCNWGHGKEFEHKQCRKLLKGTQNNSGSGRPSGKEKLYTYTRAILQIIGTQRVPLAISSDPVCRGPVYLGNSSAPPGVQPYDQGRVGSCVANSFAMAMRLSFKRITAGYDLDVSRMYLYYIGRLWCFQQNWKSPGGKSQCQGTMTVEIVKKLNTYGFVPESFWPYNGSQDEKNPYVNTPPVGWQTTAREYGNKYLGSNGWVVLEITSVGQIEEHIKLGVPVMISYSVYPGMHKDDGSIELIAQQGQKPKSGHCLLIVGYNKCVPNHVFYVLNSWGSGWGKNGIGTIPYSYFGDPQYSDGRAYAFRFTNGRKLL